VASPWDRLRQPPVLRAQAPSSVQVEGDEHGLALAGVDRAAIVAHWDPIGRVGRSVRTLLEALVRAGFETILVSTAGGAGPLDWQGRRPPRLTVLRRPNIGYDFGSWATALDRYPAIRALPAVLLFNDSLAGPFAPIDHLLDHFQRSNADVWAITDTRQLRHHLQSYCLGFKGGCLETAPLREFWSGIRVEPSRERVIERYELGLSRLLARERFVADVAIPSWRVVDIDDNPTILGWRRLLDEGLPFVKRQILREPDICPDGGSVREELRRRYDVDADEWL
jgi:lipopolysaccharide biosynthesis protein